MIFMKHMKINKFLIIRKIIKKLKNIIYLIIDNNIEYCAKVFSTINK